MKIIRSTTYRGLKADSANLLKVVAENNELKDQNKELKDINSELRTLVRKYKPARDSKGQFVPKQ